MYLHEGRSNTGTSLCPHIRDNNFNSHHLLRSCRVTNTSPMSPHPREVGITLILQMRKLRLGFVEGWTMGAGDLGSACCKSGSEPLPLPMGPDVLRTNEWMRKEGVSDVGVIPNSWLASRRLGPFSHLREAAPNPGAKMSI